ncbi:hypothetical protein H4W30_002493 [Amycolatopsis roodepoortensis]|uniref:Uncharacterized protein n=1 Tax=Amycolatopsis roodepoortensis TaxID=700274 RepID=A0ABR9L409_9PSEU|nr:hypothetical protein [Amycolatopsis roodepoortensis]
MLNDEPTEVIVLPPQPRPYLEALLPLSQGTRRP